MGLYNYMYIHTYGYLLVRIYDDIYISLFLHVHKGALGSAKPAVLAVLFQLRSKLVSCIRAENQAKLYDDSKYASRVGWSVGPKRLCAMFTSTECKR